MKKILFQYNDGGRHRAGFRENVGDCVTRSISILFGFDYLDAHQQVNILLKRFSDGNSLVPNGITNSSTKKLMKHFGLIWNPTNSFLDIPRKGKVILNFPLHVCAVIDGTIHDTHDNRDISNRIYGFWKFK
jgi:hypothetical protein